MKKFDIVVPREQKYKIYLKTKEQFDVFLNNCKSYSVKVENLVSVVNLSGHSIGWVLDCNCPPDSLVNLLINVAGLDVRMKMSSDQASVHNVNYVVAEDTWIISDSAEISTVFVRMRPLDEKINLDVDQSSLWQGIIYYVDDWTEYNMMDLYHMNLEDMAYLEVD